MFVMFIYIMTITKRSSLSIYSVKNGRKLFATSVFEFDHSKY